MTETYVLTVLEAEVPGQGLRDLISGEGSDPAVQKATLLLCPHRTERE